MIDLAKPTRARQAAVIVIAVEGDPNAVTGRRYALKCTFKSEDDKDSTHYSKNNPLKRSR